MFSESGKTSTRYTHELDRVSTEYRSYEQVMCGLHKRLIFGRPFVKRFALCYRSVDCPVCLSVTLIYYGQTVGWIKMKLGMEVGHGPGHIVLDEDPAPPTQRGAAPQFSAMSVVAKLLFGSRCHLVRR